MRIYKYLVLWFRKAVLIVLLSSLSQPFFAQDSTLIGRFSVGVHGSYFKSNISDEKSKGGGGFQLRYFPRPQSAFVMSYQNTRSTVLRYEKISKGINYSLGFGFERHVVLGNFSPYLGLEVGLNITKVNSVLVKLASNEKYFQNNLANYLFKPKAGLAFTINDHLFATAEASYYWVISADRANTNPLYDDSYTPIYFGRKLPMASIGLHYLFNE